MGMGRIAMLSGGLALIFGFAFTNLGWCQAPAAGYAGIRVTEFLARDGGSPTELSPVGEWVELHNASNKDCDLSGCRLVHDDDVHPIENTELKAGAYLVIQPTFRLRGRGGSLKLLRPEGETVIFDIMDGDEFPAQRPGVSYGISANGELAYFPIPTPGSPNQQGLRGLCEEPHVSHERGFYDAPFQVTLTPKHARDALRYTLDGSTPTETHGIVYANPIRISTTTTLRYVATRNQHLSSKVVTQSFLYLDHVIRQPEQPDGFPDEWGRTRNRQVIPGDYEMDPRVTQNTLPGYSVREALLDLPTVSVVLPVDDLFHPETGIYSHSLNRGPYWERAMSMEWIDPKGSPGFQVNAGVRMQGNSSRRPERMQKHSFRLDFQSRYGVKRLEFPVFPESPVGDFNKLVLRTPSTDSWALTGWMVDRYRPNDSQYIRDV